jgi:thioesterase domain-containing protein
LTPNGKLDRAALPAPDWVRTLDARPSAPRTALECSLAAFWCEVLELHDVGVDDNFFDIGGRSRLAAEVFARIEAELGVRLPLATLFEAPTIAQLARRIDEQGSAGSWPCLVPVQPNGCIPPFFCVHPVGGNVVSFGPLARHLGSDVPFYGIQSIGLDGSRPPLDSVEAMASAYIGEIRLVQPRGPYNVGGASFGGLVAFEMAVQLRAAGEEVGVVALLDTDFPSSPSGSLFRVLAQSRTFRRSVYPLLHRVRAHANSLRRLGPRGYVGALRGSSGSATATGTTAATGSFMRTLAQVEAANLRAAGKYVPRPYEGTLTYFRARDAAPTPDRRDLWRAMARTVHVRDVPGGHFSVRREPHVRILAALLRESLMGAAGADEAA